VSTYPYAPTHRVPPVGLQAWQSPDASQPAAANLAPNLDVQLLRWWGEWAEIRCSNGWTAWVGGRQLVPFGGAAAQGGASLNSLQGRLKDVPLPAGVSPLAAGGAALMLLGSFLPWISIHGFDSSGWDVPFFALLTGKATITGFKLGLVLLVVAAGVVGVPLLTKRPLDANLLLVAGGVALASFVLFFIRLSSNHFSAGASVGFGAYITAVGGVLLGIAFLQARRGIGAAGGPR
jgi:hypothetical protein